MFDRFKPKPGKDESDLTSLDLRADAPPALKPGAPSNSPPAPAQNAAAPVVPCPQLGINLEASLTFYKEIRRRYEDFLKSEAKLEFVFYLVYPQQGHTLSVSSPDGKKTILFLFTSNMMADAYLAPRNLKVVTAGCRIEALAEQAEKWIASGINFYGLNPCSRCANAAIYPIGDLQSEEKFRECWALDAVNRRFFAETLLRIWQNQFAKDIPGYRRALDGLRDHIDPGNPYLHMLIAGLAGMQGDKPVMLAAIKRLDQFGPPFTGKLTENSIEPTKPETWTQPVSEGTTGLLASYGLLNLPMKPAGA
jgi:hypothetical protein